MKGHNILRLGKRQGSVMSNYVVARGRPKQNYMEDWTQLKPWLSVSSGFKIKTNLEQRIKYCEEMKK